MKGFLSSLTAVTVGALLAGVASICPSAWGQAERCGAGKDGARAMAFNSGFCTPNRSIGKLTKPNFSAGEFLLTR